MAAPVSRYWPLIILAWAAIVWASNHYAPLWDDVTHDGDLAYMPPEMTTVRGHELLAAAFPKAKAKSQFAVVVERREGSLSPNDLAVADRIADLLRLLTEDPGESVYGSQEVIDNLIAENFRLLVNADRELEAADRELIQQLVAAFRPAGKPELPLVGVWNRRDEVVGEKLTSEVDDRGQATLVLLLVRHEFMATSNMQLMAALEALVDRMEVAPEVSDAGLALGISGSAAIGADTLNAAKESISNIEVTTVALVVLILIGVYRAPLLIIVTLTTMVVSVMVAVDLVSMLTQVSWIDFKVFKTTKIFVVVILFGAGTDYCLFLISRYREELQNGLDPEQAVARALGNVGDALAGSALTTMVGLGTMVFASFGKFTYSGPAIAMCLCVALLACVTLTPALLRLFGKAVFWPFGVAAPGKEAPQSNSLWSRIGGRTMFGGFWDRVSHAIVARPGLILVVCVLLLAPLAFAGWEVGISYDLLGDLPPQRQSVVSTNALKRHYAAGDIGPTTILVHQESGEFDSPQGRAKIARLSVDLARQEGITTVRSLTQPTGDPPRRRGLTAGGLRHQTINVHSRTREVYVSQQPGWAGDVTRFDVVFSEDPFSKESVARLDQLDQYLGELAADPQSPWYQAEFDFIGTTPGVRDLEAVTLADSTLIRQLVVVTVLAVLIVILRRPMISMYLVLSVVFSYLVTIGATELAFSWLYGPSFSGLDWKAPIFLFVILVAIGEDYNIYLTTRIFEEQRLFGPIEGLRQAVVRTGGIITSCGLIMAGSFLSMMTGTLRAMSELGFALSLGVLLDTFVVRPVLVPCFLVLVYRWREARERRRSAAPTETGIEPVPVPLGRGPHARQPERAPSR